ncbi:NADPH:quinone oxidoreductase family protein [Rhodococcus sp. IEGM 1379]|uniref:NADPH:quinone oxidoreductase family protein n=1 Tax=Rhodococcus sp. IEGM 1379 TaxID=3047086 RepID=UPI0024B835E1|nr:NADPH:quinone oxidoreductase family protein [Rhodococcus sp. IEGM 1379]MDI9914224.1 NADPH:quinone oxidoreductase family protein [Rhodococcus sp. IEGM 1379]
MKAHQCHTLGEPDVLRLTDVPDPVAAPGTVIVDVRACGINFPDGLMVAGNYQTKPPLPFTPGSEVAGVIRAVGDGVEGLNVGTRVLAFCGIGGYAEQVSVPASQVFAIPGSMSYPDAAGFSVTYGTSYHGLVDRAGLAAGERLLVLGAAGGVGLTAVEIGRALGAEVIAAASTAEKLALCEEHGASTLINYAECDLASELKTRERIDVVYDPVGGDAAQAAIRALQWGGRYLTVGYASGDIPKVGMNRLLISSASLLGVLWGAWAKRNPAENASNMRQLLDWYEHGLLVPHVSRTLPFDAASEALNIVMNRQAAGKVILVRD